VDSREIQEYYVTFGVQYSLDPERGELHPLGMHKDGYAVIEAPDFATAQRIASAIFENKYAFIYDWEDFMADGTFARWYSDQEGPLLTIKWIQP
jgi:hypothetical protein